MQVMHFCRGVSGVVLPFLGSDSPLCTSRWSTLWWRTLPHRQSPCSSCLFPCTRSPRLPRACCTNGNAQLVKISHGVLGGPVKTRNYLMSFAFSLGPVCGCAWDQPMTTAPISSVQTPDGNSQFWVLCGSWMLPCQVQGPAEYSFLVREPLQSWFFTCTPLKFRIEITMTSGQHKKWV